MSFGISWLSILNVLVFVLLMLIIGYVLFRHMMRQSRDRSEKKLETIESLVDFRKELQSKDELGDLMDNFDRMESALLTQMENITIMTAEREKAQAELNVATRIQRDALPHNFDSITKSGKCDIYASMTPAREVGGDFYDFFMISEGKLCIVIADVSGKGVPGALFMMVSKVLIKQRAMAGGSPSEILQDVNNLLCADNKEMLFVTVWLGIIDLDTGEMTYCNAGHEYPIIVSAGKSNLISEKNNDPPLALMEDMVFEEKRMTLASGDGVFVYTDGVAEAKDENNARYGVPRILEIIDQSDKDDGCEQVLKEMKKDLASFVKNKEPFDDVTMLMVRRC